MTPTAHFPDVSHFEPVASFWAVKQDNCPLVVTKCTEGTGYTDPTYQGYADRVRSTGMIFFSYVFEDAAPAGPQVDHYLSTAHLQPGDGMPIVDAEKLGLTKAETFAALQDLADRGYSRPILYCDLDFFRNTLGSPLDWWLWLADYNADLPSLPDGVKLWAWQHTDHAEFDGIGFCDGNYLYVDVADLPSFTIGG
jgi:lysozyme